MTILPSRRPKETSRRPLPTLPYDLKKPRRAQLVFILGALSAFGPLSIDMYLPVLPSLTRDFGTGDAQTQLTLSACLLGLALGQTIAGPISDELGRRRPLLVGLTAYAFASLLCVFARQYLRSFCSASCRALPGRPALSSHELLCATCIAVSLPPASSLCLCL